jgi:Arc/MetJ family transcription regulator
MRTHIDIDEQLLEEAMRLSGARTKREVVALALQTLVRLRQQEGLRKLRGKLDWQGDLDAMRIDCRS